MRTSLALIVCAAGLSTRAQPPEVGPAQFFQVGSSYLRFSYDIHPDNAASLIAADGPLYTIGLSWLPEAILYTSDSIACVPAPGNYLYYPEYYDTANVQLTIIDRMLGARREFLFLVEGQRVQYVGGQPNGSGNSGDDLVFQQYPGNAFETVLRPGIVYGTTWTDTIDGLFNDASGSDFHYLNGTATTTADGAGSITLPDGTLLPHTLRLRSVYHYLDSNAFFGNTQRHDTLYTWWVDSWDAPLMTLPVHDYGMLHGYVDPLPFTIYQRLGATTTIPEHARGPLTLMPNPCSTVLHLGQQLAAGAHVVVRDASGRVVLRPSAAEAMRGIGVQALAPGLYVLQILEGGHRSVLPFVRE